MPLFSGLEPDFFENVRFHPSWCADWTIDDLELPHRAVSLCESFGMKDLGELLLRPGDHLLMIKHFGEGTAYSIYTTVRFILLGGLEEQQRRIDYSSFSCMVESWIQLAIQAAKTKII